jgi:hypothetical protein
MHNCADRKGACELGAPKVTESLRSNVVFIAFNTGECPESHVPTFCTPLGYGLETKAFEELSQLQRYKEET